MGLKKVSWWMVHFQVDFFPICVFMEEVKNLISYINMLSETFHWKNDLDTTLTFSMH